MNKLDLDYQNLLKDILENGVEKNDRTGTGTISVFGRQIRHRMSDGFPLLTTKKMAWKSVVTELLWFLRGDTDIRFLWKNNCHIWDGDWYKQYSKSCSNPYSLEEMIQFGLEWDQNPRYFDKSIWDLGPIYGKQWRAWRNHNNIIGGGEVFDDLKRGFNITREEIEKEFLYVDQIQNLIRDIKINPDSRRLMVSAWNPGQLDEMLLPPCHYGFQVYTRELRDEERLDWMKKNRPKTILPMRDPNIDFSMDEFFRPYGVPTRAISLMFNMRSVDVPLGLPFNLASYGLLLEILAKMVNGVPDELVANLGDTHIYLNQIDGIKEQIGRDLTDEERYNIWFKNNYETGMEKHFNPEKLPDFDNPYYEPTPKRTREPYQLPNLQIADEVNFMGTIDAFLSSCDKNSFTLDNYQSHAAIKMPLSN